MKSRAFWALQIAGWLAFVVALMVPWLGAFPLPRMLWNKLPLIATGFAVTLALRFGYRRFLRRGAPIWLLGVAAIAGSWLGSLVWAAAAAEIVRQTGVGAIERGALIRAAIDRTDDTLYFALVLLTWSLLYFGIAHYRSSLQERALAHEAWLLALRYQLHPHFLFNALNALSTLIAEKRNGEAARMVEQLAGFLRSTLEGGRAEVPLREELELARRYLAIEQVRFGDRLRTRFEVDEGLLDAKVPSLILQPLLENAVRHGIGAREDGGCIEVRASRRGPMLSLQVRDDGPGMSRSREGIGLSNTRARLSELYGEQQRFEVSAAGAAGTRVTVELPILPRREAA